MKKILIVAESVHSAARQTGTLNRADIQIFTAMNTKEALDLHRNHPVDLMVIDLDIPGTPGDELCSIVRKNDSLKKVSVLMVCNNSRTEIQRCQDCKANAYITRPVKSDLFLEKISRLLDIPTRKSVRVLLKLSVEGMHVKDQFFCKSLDISTSGLLLESDKPLKVNSLISCSFFLPGSGQMTVTGKVVRTAKSDEGLFQYGISFANADSKTQAAIEEFIRKRT